MGLNRYEKKLIKVLDENPDINTRKFIKLSKLGKTSFYKYSQSLEIAGFISYRQVKNQRMWSLPRMDKRHDLGLPDLAESEILEKRYQKIESMVIKSLREVKKGNVSEKIDVYGDAIVLILATLGSMRLVSIYRKKRVPDYYVKFVKRLELLLKKISDAKFFSDYGFGRTAIDSIAYDAERKLDFFLGINPDESKETHIY